MVSVTVILAFSSGEATSIEVPHGSTVGDVAARVGAPSAAQYRLNGSPSNRTSPVGNGDQLLISAGKVDAGC